MTVQQLPGSTSGRPLTEFVGATQRAVDQALAAAEQDAGGLAIGRLSGHLAAMGRTVYPQARGQSDGARQLRADCLSSARRLQWALRLLECQLSGEASTVGLPVTAVFATLAEHLRGYRSAEQALVTWIEDQLPAERRDRLALQYGRALTRGPTRPHPRCPWTGPVRCVAFWLYGRWDRLLDTMDARPGVGRGFPKVPSCQDTMSDVARRPE
jgi:hypothetical protein